MMEQKRDANAPPAILLLGPTASGKTGVAVELVERLPLEIISVDSAQVFRHMDIGTAKPDADTLRVAPHHLIDIIEPTESYSAAQFRVDALNLMARITASGKVPLLVGGTMLYFKALTEGLAELPAADPALRAALEARAMQEGWPRLHAELARVDPETAARLAPHDAQRIQRALEVYTLTGTPLSRLLATRSTEPPLPYRILPIALVPAERAFLHRRIAQRFQAMLEAGLIEEVEWLRAHYPLDPRLPSMRCVGYRQVWDYLEGHITRAELAERGVFATRQLAKRQLTWLRSMTGLTFFSCEEADLASRVASLVRRFLGS
jgi:tRNA dimethylallyltransferase